MMVEAGANEVSEEVMVEALNFGHQAIKQIIGLQKELYAKINPKKSHRDAADPSMKRWPRRSRRRFAPTWKTRSTRTSTAKLESYALVDAAKEKGRRNCSRSAESEQAENDQAHLRCAEGEDFPRPDPSQTRASRQAEVRRRSGTSGSKRGVLPRTHGSAVFTRGETQALVTATLGTADDVQRMDWLEGESYKRFMMHYNFPPFSVGEISPLRGPGRREIGHGALAERALIPVIPPEETWPYTIRVVSDILESNGSSSMATVCGGTLALMDAGVPIKAPVAGVAMGLVKEGDNYADSDRYRRRRRSLRRHGFQGCRNP